VVVAMRAASAMAGTGAVALSFMLARCYSR
jgi:hypothetical protein